MTLIIAWLLILSALTYGLWRSLARIGKDADRQSREMSERWRSERDRSGREH